jgi:hypothetical protein
MTFLNRIFNKKIDLFPYIKKHSKIIEKKLQNFDLISTFPHVWQNKNNLMITIYWAKPIWFNEGVFIWHKVVIRGDNSENNLKKVIEDLKLMPFKDKFHGIHFNKKTKTASCYINPDYPNGFNGTQITLHDDEK